MDTPLGRPPSELLTLFSDGLSLVYHEGRHVRFLIKGGHLPGAGWEKLVGLPKNRVEAWKAVQAARQTAAQRPTAALASAVFEKHFGRDLQTMQELYQNPKWKHASAVGGHAWRTVTCLVRALGLAIDEGDSLAAETAGVALIRGRHNNGLLFEKIAALDTAISIPVNPLWGEGDGG